MKRVVVLAFPELVLLDAVGPCEVFSMANRILHGLRPGAADAYVIEVVSVRTELRVVSSSGLALLAHRHIGQCSDRIDTLLVPGRIGGEVFSGKDISGKDIAGKDNACEDPLLGWLREMAPRVRRLGSVCTGAFILAAAGLLNGRRATTHWQDCQRLARDYPGIRVEPDRIFVKDGSVYSSAGVTAGMDLALALVEEDLGRDLALKVARTLVMFMRRPGGQSQFSTVLESQAAERKPLRDLAVWMAQHPADDLSVEALAARVNMRARNFSRVFRRELGKTPARYVEALRVEAARRMLEETADGMDRIARQCGLGSGNSMLRSFLRVSGIPPSRYRDRLRAG